MSFLFSIPILWNKQTAKKFKWPTLLTLHFNQALKLEKLCNDDLESSFKELKKKVSSETLLSYPDRKIPLKVHTGVSDKQLDTVISQNNKHTAFFSRIFSKPQRNCTTNEKELLAIVERLKQYRRIIFGYEINLSSDHANMVYDATLSES